MKAVKLFCLVVCGLIFLAAGSVRAFQERDVPVKDYRKGEVLVKYRPAAGELQRGQVRSLARAWKIRRYSRLGIEKLSLSAGLSALEAVELLNSDPSVEYAELNQRVQYLAIPRTEPNDPGFMSGDQWYLDAPLLAGSHVGSDGTVFIDIDIDAPEAWAVMEAVFESTMAASVGVLDSGCGENGDFSFSEGYQPNHEDLTNEVLWFNPDELLDPGTDSPADANTLVDDVNGWDFIDNDNNPADEYDSVAPYHGTHISGIIAGAWGNGVGVAGIGRGQTKVQPLRVAYLDEILEAIDYAILTSGTPPVRVLNASWKFSYPVQSLLDAINAAGDAGIVFVAAAGNGGSDRLGDNNDISTGSNRVYPARYTLHATVPPDNLLAVGATDINGRLAGFSNYGPESVQIAAPGVDIYSPAGGSDGYTSVNGTSFSTPIAASALALVMSANPTLSPAEAIDRVVDGGDFDARLSGLIRSGKRVNLAGALAPFAPYSGSAPMDTLTTVSLYADSVSSLYGSIVNAISDSPSVAVMGTTSSGAWAVSPVSPGLATFNLEFDGVAAPVGTYGTGLWRVTGISPFSASIESGQSMSFTSLIPGSTIDWSVMNPTVGTIDSNGLFTALSYGTTRIILTVDGLDVDNSGTILVLPAGTDDADEDGFTVYVDCDDLNPYVNPGADEWCIDGIDNDCDGAVDSQDPDCAGSGGSGCGTTALPPGEPMWPVILALMGMFMVLIWRRYRSVRADLKSKI